MIKTVWNNIFVDTYNKIEAEKSTSKQLDKKAKSKFTQQRFTLEAEHKDAIHKAVVALHSHQFAGYQNLA